MKAGYTAMIQRPRHRVPRGSMLVLPDPKGQTEQIHPQTFDEPFFRQNGYDLHALGSQWTDSREGILCRGFKGVQEEIPSEEASTLQIGLVAFYQDNTPIHDSILVTENLTKMGIKIVSHPPYSPDRAPCDFCLFLISEAVVYETIKEMKESMTKVIDTLTQEKRTSMGPSKTVQQMRCSRRRLFHVGTINKMPIRK